MAVDRRAVALPDDYPYSFAIGRPWADGFLDWVYVDRSGIVRLIGWSKYKVDSAQIPAIYFDGLAVPLLQQFRYARPDVPNIRESDTVQTGVAFEYLAPASMDRFGSLTIQIPGGGKLQFKSNFDLISPNYRNLFDTEEVLHRDHIYGSGPPNKTIHPDVLELAKSLRGPVLDFGCGRGALVEELRQLGVDAWGLELDSPVIRQSLGAGKAEAITFYDGSFPSPLQSGRFRSVICSEVLEHIPDYAAAIVDIARLARERVLFTVPDSSAIPVGFRHGAIPWHMLEGTHVNFFTQRSLSRVLRPHFSSIQFGRIGPAQFNESNYYVSLSAVCSK